MHNAPPHCGRKLEMGAKNDEFFHHSYYISWRACAWEGGEGEGGAIACKHERETQFKANERML